jgi:cell division protein FtsQ
METKEKVKQRQRPAQQTKRPASSARPAVPKKNPAKKPAAGTAAKRPASDRARREAAARAAKIKAMKQQVGKTTAPKRRVSKPRRPMQPVVYTQPKVFNRNRFAVQLLTIAVSVLAVVLCLSIFFRVENVTVSGANAYSAWDIREASGIQEGDYLLTFGKARACAKIKAELPYVDTVRIGIKLPDTVNIVIEEIDVVYAIQDQDGIWWLMTSEGRIMEQTDAAGASAYTKVMGVKIYEPEPEKQAVAFQNRTEATEATEATQPEGETQVPTPLNVTEQQKLLAALDILQALELNEVVGEAASVDVGDLTRIWLWYGTRYQVNLGDVNDMDYKIACLKGAVNKLSDYDSGELDISFTTWPDKVTYTPFD